MTQIVDEGKGWKVVKQGSKVILVLDKKAIRSIYARPDYLPWHYAATVVKTRDKTWEFPYELYDKIYDAFRDWDTSKIIIEYSRSFGYKVIKR